MSAIAERAGFDEADATHQAGRRPWASLGVTSDIAELEADWRALEATGLVTPYQSFDWVTPYLRTVARAHGEDIRLVCVRDSRDTLVAILPLHLTRRNGVRFAEFIGGKHANYHMGVYAPAFAKALDSKSTEQLLREAAALFGQIDAFVFINQPPEWDGIANPMALLAGGHSPSRAYKLKLVPGQCEATLNRSMSSHARKKHKNKRNRFADHGTSQMVQAGTPEEVDAILADFLAQKAARFAGMGVPDPFADPAIRAFLREAALPRPDGRPPVIELTTLNVEGACVATYVGAVHRTRFSGMATSFAMGGEIAKTSPGEILLVDLIKRKCHSGIETFDLGVGDARYKTTICDEKDDLVDSFFAVTAKGRAYAHFSRWKRALKGAIKQNPTALKIAQRASGLLRGRRQQASAEE